MLSAHLDFTNDAASRNITVIQKTVAWICSVVKARSSILDLGCGPGIYAEEFAKQKCPVVGIDISKRSIKHARKSARNKKLGIIYHHQSYLTDEIKGRYDTAVCIYCDFGALIPAEQKLLLKKINSVLKDDGCFIFDVFSGGLSSTKTEGRKWNFYNGSSFFSRKAHFVMEETVHFKEQNVWGTRNIVFNKDGKSLKEYITWDTYYTKESISSLLEENGFKVEETRNDIVEANSFTSNDVMFIKAKKL
jgi:ubiquinone/menaquinone biosynthesis C-methylase UbiE